LVACSSDKSATSSSSSSTTATIPGDRFELTGTATLVIANRAVSDAIKPPFTITVEERGTGGAEITPVTVNGKESQIDWGTGQPLPWRSTDGALDLGIAGVHIDSQGITWSLDGSGRDVLPGTYSLGSSVAVGAGGLGKPVDNVTFTAGDETTLSTRGGASITLPPSPIRIEGRDGRLGIQGDLKLSGPSGDRTLKRVTFGPGTYEVTLTPVNGGYRVTARLEGPVLA
jgi:hypothetical protein